MDNLKTSVHFQSESVEWATPQEFFNKLNEEFDFQLDVCATEQNTKCSNFFTKEMNGLCQEWQGVCWCNPPYGRQIKDWIKKSYETAKQNKGTVVCLIPARTDTNWWHEYVMKATEIRFIKGRLKFNNHKNSAPFPSALVVFSHSEVK
jgi:site-specific DNA-methyltransferase (adenine-specific)